MKTKLKVIITFLLIVAIITGMYIFTGWFSRITGFTTGEDASTSLASCLASKEVEFYFSKSKESEDQISLFEQSRQLFKNIDCGDNGELCPNLRLVPAWYINKKIIYGYQSLD